MKIIKVASLLIMFIFGVELIAPAQGTIYNFTFTAEGPNTDAGYGQILVDGGYAISGYFDVTAGAGAGYYVLYTVDGTGTYQKNGFVDSPYTQFYYDNAVYLTSNPQYPNTNPFVDFYGLLFANSDDHSHTSEVSIWAGSDNGTYTYDAYINGDYIDPNGILGNATIVVPEPSSLSLTTLMLVLTGVFFRPGRKAALD